MDLFALSKDHQIKRKSEICIETVDIVLMLFTNF